MCGETSETFETFFSSIERKLEEEKPRISLLILEEYNPKDFKYLPMDLLLILILFVLFLYLSPISFIVIYPFSFTPSFISSKEKMSLMSPLSPPFISKVLRRVACDWEMSPEMSPPFLPRKHLREELDRLPKVEQNYPGGPHDCLFSDRPRLIDPHPGIDSLDDMEYSRSGNKVCYCLGDEV